MRTILFITALFMSTLLSAQKPVEIPLWPNGAPNTNGLTGDQEDLDGGRVANVINPTITVYRPAKPNGMTILMCPGGGYARLAMNHEGHDMASWFNTQGITYAVLKYRMPNGNREVPLSDAEQAIRIIRQHAKEWGINPNQVGVMGASAGGPLLSLHFTVVMKRVRTFRYCFIRSSRWYRVLLMEVRAIIFLVITRPKNWKMRILWNVVYLPALRKLSSYFLLMMALCRP